MAPVWFLVTAAMSGCVGHNASATADARYPPRPPGCPVRIFGSAPSMTTDNIGPVRARCSTDVPQEDCLRELKDQVCRLGGDVVWGVADEPRLAAEKNEWDGRAAHTK